MPSRPGEAAATRSVFPLRANFVIVRSNKVKQNIIARCEVRLVISRFWDSAALDGSWQRVEGWRSVAPDCLLQSVLCFGAPPGINSNFRWAGNWKTYLRVFVRQQQTLLSIHTRPQFINTFSRPERISNIGLFPAGKSRSTVPHFCPAGLAIPTRLQWREWNNRGSCYSLLCFTNSPLYLTTVFIADIKALNPRPMSSPRCHHSTTASLLSLHRPREGMPN